MRNTLRALTLTLLLLGPTLGADAKRFNINDFQRTYFKIINKESNFYQVDTNLEGLDSQDILATGYLSEDLNLDLILVDRETQTLTFQIYSDKDKGGFYQAGEYKLESQDENEKIQAVHFAQVQAKSRDVLVLISKSGAGPEASFKMKGFEMDAKKKDDQSDSFDIKAIPGYEIEFQAGVDDAGDPLNFQLFDKVDEKGSHNVTSYWLIMKDGARSIVHFDAQEKTMKVQKFEELFDTAGKADEEQPAFNEKATFAKGGAFYFVDFNYDCRADVMVETFDAEGQKKYLEFYYFTGEGKPFSFIRQVLVGEEGDALSKYSSPRLADLRQSNSLDLVLYNNVDKSLDIFLARGPKENPQEIQTFCNQANQSSREFPFPDIHDQVKYTNNTGYTYRIQMHDDLYESQGDIVSNNFGFADLNMNGFPDLVMLTKEIGQDSSGSTTARGKLKIFNNLTCTDDEAADFYSGEDFKKRCRLFKEEPFDAYNTSLGAVAADRFGLFDFGERGIIGFFLVEYALEDGQDRTHLRAFLNFINWENYNLKGVAKYSRESMGSVSGIKMLVKKTTNTAEYEVLSSTPSLNMPNNEFNMPFVIFGLGQITNYLEDFTLGYGVRSEPGAESRDFTPIIPNSRLIVYTPSEKNSWELEILLNPNNAMLMILISTVCVLFVLGVIIFALYCKESKKDKQKDAINMATFTPW